MLVRVDRPAPHASGEGCAGTRATSFRGGGRCDCATAVTLVRGESHSLSRPLGFSSTRCVRGTCIALAPDPMSERKLKPRTNTLVTFLASGHSETLPAVDIGLRGAFLVLSAPHPSIDTPLLLVLEHQPPHVPPLNASVASVHDEVDRTGCALRFERLVPSQRHMLIMRHAPKRTVGGGIELGWLLRHAPSECTEFCALHPYPFLLGRGSAVLTQTPVRTSDVVHLVHGHGTPVGCFAPVHVGRDEHSDIAIDDPRISRQHAVFDRSRGRLDYVVLDKGSRNGTRVDMIPLRPMEPRSIQSGSMILFGDLPFLFLSARDLFASITTSGLTGHELARERDSWSP